MKVAIRFLHRGYYEAHKIVEAGGSSIAASTAVRRHAKPIEVAAGLGLIANSRHYLAKDRKFAREVLETLICE